MSETRPENVSFFERIKRGFFVTLKSLKFAWQHKKLLLFPIFTGIATLAAIGIYDSVYYAKYDEHITKSIQTISQAEKEFGPDSEQYKTIKEKYIIRLLIFFLIISIVYIFFSTVFNVAVSFATSQAFINQPINLGASIGHSLKKFPTLLIWTLTASSIHLLTNLLRKNSRSSFLSDLLGDLINIAWYVATFLIIPVFALEDKGTFKSIKQSAALMKKTFGENITSALFLDLFLRITAVLWIFIALFIYFGPLIILGKLNIQINEQYTMPMIIGFLIFLFIGEGILTAFCSTANTIYKTATYHYALGNPIGLFNAAEMQSSFVSEKKMHNNNQE